MSSVTRTLNPLHFEDLEPKRFEDLIRQLAYDFKIWRRLEATGRSGSDDGFDARGYERIDLGGSSLAIDEEQDAADNLSDRLWLIQCKREKTINPAKMHLHLSAIKLDKQFPIHGIILASACDFSKKSRDVLISWCRDNGINEWHIWGKAELEDQLLQPKNDGILFAYFGISLLIRRRSKVTEVRRQLMIKNKLKQLLEDSYLHHVLIRDIEDERYPYDLVDGDNPNWRVREVVSVHARGLILRRLMRPAWISSDSDGWDAAFGSPGQDSSNGFDYWNIEQEKYSELNIQSLAIWQKIPDIEKAWVYTDIIVPYSQIVLIDDVGDDVFDGPHVYVSDWNASVLGCNKIESMESPKREFHLDDDKYKYRVNIFPNELRENNDRFTGY